MVRQYGALILILAFVSCASAFPYKWYGLSLPSYDQGSLLGEEEEDDLPMSVCEPDAEGVGQCSVMLIHEFEKLRLEYDQLKEDLQACQEQLASTR